MTIQEIEQSLNDLEQSLKSSINLCATKEYVDGKTTESSSYLTNKKLFFREALLRMISNASFSTDDTSFRSTMYECIKRASELTKEVFRDDS